MALLQMGHRVDNKLDTALGSPILRPLVDRRDVCRKSNKRNPAAVPNGDTVKGWGYKRVSGESYRNNSNRQERTGDSAGWWPFVQARHACFSRRVLWAHRG